MLYEVTNVNDLKDGEMKDYKIEVGKVLLSRIDGQFYATSHLCPHYKAPLAKGTLSSDGRLMCPWHGACFRVQTGDIEDAPSMDHLQSFKVVVKGDKVFVDADAENVQAGRKIPKCTKTQNGRKLSVIIIGGGAGGLAAAESLRERGFSGKVTIISRENYLPIDRPKLSKGLKIVAEKVALRTAEQLKDMDIETEFGVIVTDVNTQKKQITLNIGGIRNYDKLIIATGGDPRILPFPGHDLKNIFVMRTIDDTNNIGNAMSQYPDSKPNVVIVGSGFIGMEAASILYKVANVTVIGMEQYPFERVLGPKIGKAIFDLNKFYGIQLEMEQLVEKYLPSTVDPTKVGGVVLKSGKSIPADFVILGAGAIPKTDFLKNSGITLDRDGGISVKSSMQVPGVEGVYAVGDIARYPYHITGEKVRVEHWCVAQNQGRFAAECIMSGLSQPEEFLPAFKQIPYFWTVQFGKSIRYAGHASSFDDVIIQGNTELDSAGGGLAFAAFYTKNNKVIAVCSLGKDPVVSHASELLRLGKMPSGSEIKAGMDILTIQLKTTEKFISKSKPIDENQEQNQFLFVIAPVLIIIASTIFLLSRN